jgi:hypothetical protein
MSVEASNRAKSQKEVAAFLATNATKYVAYVSGDGKYLTTWMGDELARITRSSTSRRRGFGPMPFSVLHVRAVDIRGRHWSGTGAGRNMFIRIRRVKS